MRVLSALLLALTLSAGAQTEPNALLWRISRSEPVAHGFLLGTVHSRDARAYAHIADAEAAMDRCDAVFGELDLADAGLLRAAGAASIFMPGGTSLKDLYSARRYARVEKALREKLGAMHALMSRVKPLFTAAMLTEGNQREDSAHVLDEYLQLHARELGLRTGGLETPAEQLAAMDAVPLKDQADMLYEAARDKGGNKAMNKLLNAYADQDLQAIGRLMRNGDLSDAFSRSLVGERNAVMAHRIDSILVSGTPLFAVGAAHLPGPDGLLAVLRDKGFTVEPVPDLPPREAEDPERTP